MAVQIRLRLARERLRAVLAHDTGRYITLVTNRVNNRAKILAPVDTGTLRSRHTPNVRVLRSRVVGTVTVKVRYAAAVHEGWSQGPRIIRARRRKALKFVYNGRVVIVRQVRWPGARFRGRPWLRSALHDIAGPAGFRVHNTRFFGT